MFYGIFGLLLGKRALGKTPTARQVSVNVCSFRAGSEKLLDFYERVDTSVQTCPSPFPPGSKKPVFEREKLGALWRFWGGGWEKVLGSSADVHQDTCSRKTPAGRQVSVSFRSFRVARKKRGNLRTRRRVRTNASLPTSPRGRTKRVILRKVYAFYGVVGLWLGKSAREFCRFSLRRF